MTDGKYENLSFELASVEKLSGTQVVILLAVVFAAGALSGMHVSATTVSAADESNKTVLTPQQAGLKTENFINNNIFQPSPNDVTANLVNVSDGSAEGLENFYIVSLNVTNPAGSQVTEVYTKKDGSLVFLQFPRKMGEGFDPTRYS